MNLLLYITAIIPFILAGTMAFGDGIQDISKVGISLIIMVSVQFFISKFLNHIQKLLPTHLWLITQGAIFLFYGTALPLCYYWQSFEMNLAVVLAGISPGLFALAVYNLFCLIRFPDNESRENVERNRWNIYIINHSLILALLIPNIIYLIIRDHLYINTMSFLILFTIIPLSKLIKNTLYNPNHFIRFIIFLMTFYTIIFSIGWLF